MRSDRLFFMGCCLVACMGLVSCDDGGKSSCMFSEDCGDTSVYRCDLQTMSCVEINPAHCKNGKVDADETDVDCGGTCGACAVDKKCGVNKDCVTGFCDTNAKKCSVMACENDLECSGISDGKCYEGACFSCSNGVLDGDETDVDCGGALCGAKCPNDKVCKADSDCENGTCASGKCAGEPASQADLNTIVINEIMGAPDKKKVFNQATAALQCEFIELVNTLDKPQSLAGVTLNFLRTDDGQNKQTTVPLEGTVPAKSAFVVFTKECETLPMMPADVIHKQLTMTEFITNSATFKVWLSSKDDEGNDVKGNEVELSGQKQGTSNVRPKDGDASSAFVLHNTLSDYVSSPGYCSNGGVLSKNCEIVDTCSNGIKDGIETDIDCGGTMCGSCAEGQKCAADTDCNTGFCDPDKKVCAIKTCETNEDCGGDATCKDGACVPAPTCSDNIKNQDESDVDCGGSCDKCENGKTCASDKDCATGECTNGVCTGEKPEQDLSKLVINEVLGAPNKNAPFNVLTEAKQCEFIEIVNISDKKQSLDGATLHVDRVDEGKETKTSIALDGVIPAKGGYVLFTKECTTLPTEPEGVIFKPLSRAEFITNSGSYLVWLSNADGEASWGNISDQPSGISFVRSEERNPESVFVLHNTVSSNGLVSSPGYCANGGLFIHDCKTTCDSGTKDGDETDVDCGGMLCVPCAEDKACKADTDCTTGYCDPADKVCTTKPCTTDEECGSDATCIDRECVLKPTCSDGIQNQDESDVDCGGATCDKCENGKTCTKADDCANGECNAGKCAGEPIPKAQLNELIINEVHGAPPAGQYEFVEIVNLTENKLSLEGMVMTHRNQDGSAKPKDSKLSGLILPNSAVVVVSSSAEVPSFPKDVNVIKSLEQITNKAQIFKLTDAEGNSSEEVIVGVPTNSGAISMNRKSDFSSEEFIKHTEVSTNLDKLNNSPGYCANGKIISKGCVD